MLSEFDAFLSHRHTNRRFAKRLSRRLRRYQIPKEVAEQSDPPRPERLEVYLDDEKLVVFVGAICNLIGLKEMNLLFSALASLIVLIIGFQPKFLLAIFGGGSIAGLISDDIDGLGALREYSRIVLNAAIWISFLFLLRQ